MIVSNEVRNQINLCRQNKDFISVVDIYDKLYAQDENNLDKWSMWQYADALKRTGRIVDAESVCKQLYKDEPEFTYNNNLYAWCIYYNRINNVDMKCNDEKFKEVLEYGEFITNIVRQEEFSAYEVTVIKIIKLYKAKSNYMPEKIIYWLDKLNPVLLSEKCYTADYNGKKMELQSNRELYYGCLTKSLLLMEKYDMVIDAAENALTIIEKFHHDNDSWIKLRKAIAMEKTGDFEKAVELIENVLVYKRHWYIYFVLGDMYIRNSLADIGMLYLSKAVLEKDSSEIKIKLYEKISEVLRSEGNKKAYDLHMTFVGQIKQNHCTNNLAKEIEKYHVTYIKEKELVHRGRIIKILYGGECGFIEDKNKSTVFLKKQSILYNKVIMLNQNVSFVVDKAYNHKKSRIEFEARYIEYE